MSATRIIKKYPNRRLYDTETSNYITMAEVKALVLSNVDFRVMDAKTGEDLSRSILLQIILEEETVQGVPMFTSEVLTQIIRFYGHAMQGVMGSYLEKSIGAFIGMQQKLQDQARAIYGETPKMNTEMWTQMFKNQPPGVPNLMGSYMEQSANVFLEVQEQMRKQALSLFGAFPYQPGVGGPEDAQQAKQPEPRVEAEEGNDAAAPNKKRST